MKYNVILRIVSDRLSATMNDRTLYLSDYRRKLVVYSSSRKTITSVTFPSDSHFRTLAFKVRNEVITHTSEHMECRTRLRTVGLAL